MQTVPTPSTQPYAGEQAVVSQLHLILFHFVLEELCWDRDLWLESKRHPGEGLREG